MPGPQRPARGSGGDGRTLPPAAHGSGPASRIPPLRCGRRPLRRPGRPGALSAPTRMEDAAEDLLVYTTIGVSNTALRRAGAGRDPLAPADAMWSSLPADDLPVRTAAG